MFDQRNCYDKKMTKENDNYPPYCCPSHQLPLSNKVCANKYATPLYYTSIWKEQSQLPAYVTKELERPLPVLEGKPATTGASCTRISPELQQLFREQHLQQRKALLGVDVETPQAITFQYDQKFFKQPTASKTAALASDSSRKSLGSKLYMRHLDDILSSLREYGDLTEAQTKFLEKDLRYLASLPSLDKAQIVERLKARGLLTDAVKDHINDIFGPMAGSILPSIEQPPAQPYGITRKEQIAEGGTYIEPSYLPRGYADEAYVPGLTDSYADQAYAQRQSGYIDQQQLAGKRSDPYQKDVYSSQAYRLAKQPGGYEFGLSEKKPGGLDRIYDKTREQMYPTAKRTRIDISRALRPFIRSSVFMPDFSDADRRPGQSISQAYATDKRPDQSISQAQRPVGSISRGYKPDRRVTYYQPYWSEKRLRKSLAADMAKKKITFDQRRYSDRLSFRRTQRQSDATDKYTTNIRGASMDRTFEEEPLEEKEQRKDELNKLQMRAYDEDKIAEKPPTVKPFPPGKKRLLDKELKNYFNANNIFRKKGLAMDPYEVEKLKSVLSKSTKDLRQSADDNQYMKRFLENLGRMKPQERGKYMNKLQKNKVLNMKALDTLQKYAAEGDAELNKEDVAHLMNNIDDVTKANIKDNEVLNHKYMETAIEDLAKGKNANMETFLTEVAKLSGDQRKSYFGMTNVKKLVTPNALQMIKSYMNSNKTKLRLDDVEKLQNLFRKSNFYTPDESDGQMTMEKLIERNDDLKHLIKTLKNENNTLSDDEKEDTILELIKKIFQTVPNRISEFVNSSYVQQNLDKATLKQIGEYTKTHMNEFYASLSQVEELVNAVMEASTDPAEMYGDVNALRANSLESVLVALPERLARKYLEGLEIHDLARDDEQWKFLHKLAYMDTAQIKPFLKQVIAKGILPHEAIPDILSKLLQHSRIQADKAHEIQSVLNEYKMKAARKSLARPSVMPRRPSQAYGRRRSEMPYRSAQGEKRKSYTIPTRFGAKELVMRPHVPAVPSTTAKKTYAARQLKAKVKPEISKHSLKVVSSEAIAITPITSESPIGSGILSDVESEVHLRAKDIVQPKPSAKPKDDDQDDYFKDELKDAMMEVQQTSHDQLRTVQPSTYFEERRKAEKSKEDESAKDSEREKSKLQKEGELPAKLKTAEALAKSEHVLSTEVSKKDLAQPEKEKKKLKKEGSSMKLRKPKEHRKDKQFYGSEGDLLKFMLSSTEAPKVEMLKDPTLKSIIRRKREKQARGSISSQSKAAKALEESEQLYSAPPDVSERSTSSDQSLKKYLTAPPAHERKRTAGRARIGTDFRSNLERYHPPPALIDLNNLLWKLASMDSIEMTESFIRNLWRKGEITARKLNDLYRLTEKNPQLKPDKRYALLDTMKLFMAKKIIMSNLPKLRISYYPPIIVRGHTGIRLLRPQPLRHPSVTINYTRGLCSYIPYLRRTVIEFAPPPEEPPSQPEPPSPPKETPKTKQSAKKR